MSFKVYFGDREFTTMISFQSKYCSALREFMGSDGLNRILPGQNAVNWTSGPLPPESLVVIFRKNAKLWGYVSKNLQEKGDSGGTNPEHVFPSGLVGTIRLNLRDAIAAELARTLDKISYSEEVALEYFGDAEALEEAKSLVSLINKDTTQIGCLIQFNGDTSWLTIRPSASEEIA